MKKIFMAMAFVVFSFALIVSAQAQTCGDTTWPLTAGQYTDVGSITVSNNIDHIDVTYTLDYPGATFGILHVWVGYNLFNVPATRKGNPIPGQFCHTLGGDCYDATGLTTYTFTIPFSDLDIVDANAECSSHLFVFAHADVTGSITEGAWGGGIDVNVGEPGKWYFYGDYTICCDFGGGEPCYLETAFAKGGWIFTTNEKSNPEDLPSLNLTENRWGWAINLTAPGETEYDIWAGAGLNNTANGMLVGTLKVMWDGTNATVSYSMKPGYYLEEVHIYAGNASPPTTAPGQYGNPTEGYDVGGITTFDYTLPLADLDGDGVWLIAHALVSNGQCD